MQANTVLPRSSLKGRALATSRASGRQARSTVRVLAGRPARPSFSPRRKPAPSSTSNGSSSSYSSSSNGQASSASNGSDSSSYRRSSTPARRETPINSPTYRRSATPTRRATPTRAPSAPSRSTATASITPASSGSGTDSSSYRRSSTPARSTTPIDSSTYRRSSTPARSSTPINSSSYRRSSTPDRRSSSSASTDVSSYRRSSSSTPSRSTTPIESSSYRRSSTPARSSTPINSPTYRRSSTPDRRSSSASTDVSSYRRSSSSASAPVRASSTDSSSYRRSSAPASDSSSYRRSSSSAPSRAASARPSFSPKKFTAVGSSSSSWSLKDDKKEEAPARSWSLNKDDSSDKPAARSWDLPKDDKKEEPAADRFANYRRSSTPIESSSYRRSSTPSRSPSRASTPINSSSYRRSSTPDRRSSSAASDSSSYRRSSSSTPVRAAATDSSSYRRSSTPEPKKESSAPQRASFGKKNYSQVGRWKGLDEDVSDDQQDITRGRDMIDSLYQGYQGSGTGGTHNAVLSSSEYLSNAQRTLNNIEEGFYISPAFLDKISIHIAKNFLDLPKIKVPLILGIWGGKGQGKTFQCNLAYKKLGINPIVMSAGELESGNAGEPAKLIRQRYREASDIIKKGKMCSLFINDLDAGAGRMGSGTQYTVNNQLVNATLMNIADNPTNVQLPGVYKQEEIPRVPIVCTGNDFSTLYAPLIRDGRMEKFYWAPTREDRIGVAVGIFQHDGVSDKDVETLVDTFPGQSIDFFGALRARVYDDKVRDFVEQTGFENIGKRLVNSREGKVEFPKPQMTLNNLLEYGNLLVEEQENVKRVQLAEKYMSGAELAGKQTQSLLS